MQDQNQEIFFVIVIGSVLAFLLFGFILTMFLLYQRRRQKQEKDLILLKEEYEQEALKSQLEIQESTLKGIAQELHDNIGQTLSVIKLWMSIAPIEKEHPAFEGVQNSKDMLNKVIYDMSDLTKSLHTDRITEIGLREAIHFDIVSIRKTGLLNIDFQEEGNEFHFEERRSIFLFRMYQEMMNNILKHSRATQVKVSVIYSEEYTFALIVEDNGVGFDFEGKKANPDASSGLGLKSMRNRAKMIGANMSIESTPHKGTIISVSLPLN